MEQKKLVNISKKTFFSVLILLFILMVLSVVLTYVIPKGAFGKLEDGSFDYSVYTRLENEKGIAIWKGLLAPFLILGTKDGINLIMLSIK